MNSPHPQSQASEDRFAALWLRVTSGDEPALACYERLQAAWQAPARAYHNWRHLEECLSEFDAVRDSFSSCRLDEVELALWFHDAIYDPHAADNEEQSAELAVRLLRSAGAADELISRVADLILATQAHQATPDTSTELLLDIDLSILGKGPTRFWEYEAQIREEYAWVPREVYAEKRCEILQRFLDRERVYLTEPFFEKYEASMRFNLAVAIEKLLAAPS